MPLPDFNEHGPIDLDRIADIEFRRDILMADLEALPGGRRPINVGRLGGRGRLGSIGRFDPREPFDPTSPNGPNIPSGFGPIPNLDVPPPRLEPGHISIVVDSNPGKNRPMLHVSEDGIQNPRRVKRSMRVSSTAAIDWVCKIVDPNRSGNRATGFLVGENLIMTNDHVLRAIKPSLKQVEVWFGWQMGSDHRDVVGLSGTVIFSDDALDVAILEITATPESARVAVVDVDHVPHAKDDVLVVGYPGESKGPAGHVTASAPALALDVPSLIGRKRVSPGFLIDTGTYQLLHDCSTTNGSSGSPIVDRDSDRVIGIHSGWTTWHSRDLNRATPMAVIAETLDAKGIPLPTALAQEPV
ncbi:MAG: trypsin-like serine peptidase [Acidimicrobiales bacterium]